MSTIYRTGQTVARNDAVFLAYRVAMPRHRLRWRKALILQFMEDYSDRRMESALNENIAAKWFCDFELGQRAPDHSYFGKMRDRPGTNNVAKIFNLVVAQMRASGVASDVFHFIDSTAISDGLKKLDR